MKNALGIAFAALALTSGISAHAGVQGFTGVYAPPNWTTTVLGNLTGGAGGSTVMNSTTLTITGGNAISPNPPFGPACTGAIFGIPGPCEIHITIGQIQNPFVFDWSYASLDSSAAAADFFGMLIDGVRIQLSDPGGAPTQSGHVTRNAVSSFGWYINCTDCIEGGATAVITGFKAGLQTPEPGTLALYGIAFASLALVTRRRNAAPSNRFR